MAVILTAMMAMTGLGLLLSALSLLGDGMHFLLNVSQYVLMIFTGVQFPVAQLPAAVRWISGLLPLTRSVRAMDLLLGGDRRGWIPLAAGEAALGLAYCFLAAGLLRLTARRALKTGGLELF